MRKHTAAEIGKWEQIRDTTPKMGQMGIYRENRVFPRHVVKLGMSHKILMDGNLTCD